jgi:hypothetical protein
LASLPFGCEDDGLAHEVDDNEKENLLDVRIGKEKGGETGGGVIGVHGGWSDPSHSLPFFVFLSFSVTVPAIITVRT